MRKSAIVFLFLILPMALFAGELPRPSGWINDFAGVITPEYTDKLTSLIQGLEEKTSVEIAVVTVDSIAPYDEIEYSRMLFDRWKPGKKGKDNGVLVLLAVKERRWRIETGYGIEGVLPDGLCGEIGRNYMVPYFKNGEYGQGLYLGVVKISQIIAKNANIELNIPAKTEQDNSSDHPIIMLIVSIFFFGFLFLPTLFRRRGNNVFWGGGYSGGGGFGSGGGFGGGGFGGGGFGGGGGGGGGSGGGF